MLSEVECSCHVVVPLKDLDKNELVPQSLIITRLLKQMLNWKSTEEHGYFLAVTKLKSIGSGEVEDSSRYILFPIIFRCRMFLPMNGEIMLGVVYRINRYGVFLRSGPINCVYLSAQKMSNYYYVDEENPFFLSNDLSRIENDVVIRFMVFGKRWTLKNRFVEREFMILATLEGNCLGPIALPGYDGLAL